VRTDNVGAIAAIPGMEELNIGHFIIARAAIVGMEAAVKEMLEAMGTTMKK
jgi:pyridoxine 5-phosphate synthase